MVADTDYEMPPVEHLVGVDSNAKVLKSGQDYERPVKWEKTVDVAYLKEHFTHSNNWALVMLDKTFGDLSIHSSAILSAT